MPGQALRDKRIRLTCPTRLKRALQLGLAAITSPTFLPQRSPRAMCALINKRTLVVEGTVCAPTYCSGSCVCASLLKPGGTAAERSSESSPMAERRPRLVLHCTSGEPFEVRADEIVCVEGFGNRAGKRGARIILSRTDEDGCNVQLVVAETAEAIARQLAGTESALRWQGA